MTALEAAGAVGPNVSVGYAEETLYTVMGCLLRHGIGRLPVVSREDARQIVGYLGWADILEARTRSYQEEEIRERAFGKPAVEAVGAKGGSQLVA